MISELEFKYRPIKFIHTEAQRKKCKKERNQQKLISVWDLRYLTDSSEWTPSKTNIMRTKTKYIMVKLLNANDKVILTDYIQRNINKNEGWILIRNNRGENTERQF